MRTKLTINTLLDSKLSRIKLQNNILYIFSNRLRSLKSLTKDAMICRRTDERNLSLATYSNA